MAACQQLLNSRKNHHPGKARILGMAANCWHFALCENSSVLHFASMVQSVELRPTLNCAGRFKWWNADERFGKPGKNLASPEQDTRVWKEDTSLPQA